MKTKFKSLLVLAALVGLTACTQAPQPVDEYQQIGPSETAFLVPLEGNNAASQGKLASEDYLAKDKIAAKAVIIKHHTLDTCPTCQYQHYEKYIDLPDAKLFKVSRTPAARSWTASGDTGTSNKNQAFHAEDNASIDFFIGATATAHVEEADTAKFLYRYAGQQLETIMDTVVRNAISAKVSSICGSHDLNYIRANKGAIFKQVFEETAPIFKEQGITLDNLGFTDGITYADQNVQDAINKKFAADMSVQEAASRKLAAEAMASAGDAAMKLQDLELRRRDMDIKQAIVAKWNGVLPTYVSSGADPFASFVALTGRK